MLKAACPAATVEVYEPALRRQYTECSEWRRRSMDEIRQLRPSLTLLSSYSAKYVPKNEGHVDARTASGELTVDTWRAGMRATLAELASAGLTTVVLRDTPHPTSSIPLCLARQQWKWTAWGRKECNFDRETSLRPEIASAESQAAIGLRHVSFVDLTPALCPNPVCGATRDGIIVYRDDNHLTGNFSRSSAPALASALAGIALGGN